MPPAMRDWPALRYPRLSLAGTLGYSVRVSGTSANGTQGIAAFGPVIDIPLFDWGWQRAHCRRA